MTVKEQIDNLRMIRESVDNHVFGLDCLKKEIDDLITDLIIESEGN